TPLVSLRIVAMRPSPAPQKLPRRARPGAATRRDAQLHGVPTLDQRRSHLPVTSSRSIVRASVCLLVRRRGTRAGLRRNRIGRALALTSYGKCLEVRDLRLVAIALLNAREPGAGVESLSSFQQHGQRDRCVFEASHFEREEVPTCCFAGSGF